MATQFDVGEHVGFVDDALFTKKNIKKYMR